MIILEATPHDIQSDTSLTPEEKRVLLKMLPPKIKVGNLRSPYYAYGEDRDNIVTLTVANSGNVCRTSETQIQKTA